MTILATFVGASCFALVFALVGRFSFLSGPRRDDWLAAGAGIAVAYVFIDLLPHVASKQSALLAGSPDGFGGFLRHHAYLPMLVGVIIFQASVIQGRGLRVDRSGRSVWGARISHSYRLVGSTGYVALVSYMLSEQPDHRFEPTALFVAAMALHMVGVAYYLWREHGDAYTRLYRFGIVGGAYAGWLLGVLFYIPSNAFVLLYGFLGGGIIGVAMTYEVYEVKSPRQFLFFLGGAATMTAILIGLEFLGTPPPAA